ncbi:MAG: GtrA family protein [bacterium]|nr:GtrA family protein [bacterium]
MPIKHIKALGKIIHPHLGQFGLYVVSGLTAASIDFGSFYLLLQFEVYYVTASIVGSTLGFTTAFLCHKYFVFKKHDSFSRHLGRYIIAEIFSTAAATGVLFLVAEYTILGAELAKLISMGSVVCWNFFVYKFLVYV